MKPTNNSPWTFDDPELPPQGEHSKIPQRRGIVGRVIKVLFFLVFGCAVLLGGFQGYSYLNRAEGFPPLEGGFYSGTIRGLVGLPESRGVPLILEHQADTGVLIIAVMNEGWQPERIQFRPEDYSSRVLPLEIQRGGGKLKFTGGQLPTGSYSGRVYDSESNTQGVWSLTRTSEQLPEISSEDKKRIVLYTAQLRTEEQLRAFSTALPAQKLEIEQLRSLLTDEAELRKRSEGKLEREKKEVGELRSVFNDQKAQVKKLEEQLRLAQKVSGRGKLTALARESLEREQRWVQSMSVLPAGVGGDSFEAASTRAAEIIALKASIVAERERIQDLAREVERESEGL